MHVFKKILAAVSFNPYLREELRYAAELTGALGAEMMIVNIINTRDLDAVTSISSMGYEVDGNHYVDEVRKERKAILDEIIESSLVKRIDREKISIKFKVGHPIQELLKMVVTEDVDMVIMGAKGRTNLEEVLVGSTAEKLFRRSPVTIVSYRAKEHAEKLKKKILKHM